MKCVQISTKWYLASYVLPEEELSEYVCIGHIITLPLYFELSEGDLHPYYGLRVLIQSDVMVLVRPKLANNQYVRLQKHPLPIGEIPSTQLII